MVVQLAAQRYQGANHTHFTELLQEREGIDLSRPTVRRILTKAGIGSPRSRRSPQHRFRRQRMPQAGMLVQLDGSHHAWLEDRGPKFVLLLAVDDATGTVMAAWFCEQEDAHSYFLLVRGLVQRGGLPVAFYTDRHGVFRHTPGSGLPAGPTQFSRAMAELGIQMIFAPSPQAKGRVERTAGTFQDRLVAEPRLAGATNLEQAQGSRHRLCSMSLCLGSIGASAFPHSVPSQRSGLWIRSCAWNRFCVSSTAGRWLGTTRCGSSCAHSSCCQRRNAPAMPGRRWKFWRGWTASS